MWNENMKSLCRSERLYPYNALKSLIIEELETEKILNMNYIAENISVIKNRMIEAVKGKRRNPNEVKLLLATKTVPAEGD